MDSLLVLDYFLMDKMLLPEGKATCDRETKVELARQETNKMKRLLGALRYLWRNGILNTRAKDMGFLCFFPFGKVFAYCNTVKFHVSIGCRTCYEVQDLTTRAFESWSPTSSPVQVPLFLPPSIGNVHSFCFKVWFPCWIFCIQQNPIVYTYFEPTHPHTHMYIYVCILNNRDMYTFTLYSYSFACHIYA